MKKKNLPLQTSLKRQQSTVDRSEKDCCATSAGGKTGITWKKCCRAPENDFPHAAAGKGFYSRWALTRWDLGGSPSVFGNGKQPFFPEMMGGRRGDIGDMVSDHSQLEVWLKENSIEMGRFFLFYILHLCTKDQFPYL